MCDLSDASDDVYPSGLSDASHDTCSRLCRRGGAYVSSGEEKRGVATLWPKRKALLLLTINTINKQRNKDDDDENGKTTRKP